MDWVNCKVFCLKTRFRNRAFKGGMSLGVRKMIIGLKYKVGDIYMFLSVKGVLPFLCPYVPMFICFYVL